MSLSLACPAATEVNSSAGVPSVRCGVLEVANEGEHIGGVTSRGHVDPVMDGDKDAATVRRFCCKGTEEQVNGHPIGFPNCEIWKAEKRAIEEGRKGPGALRDEEARRIDAAPHPGVGEAVEALKGGSYGEAEAIRRGMESGAVVLGG